MLSQHEKLALALVEHAHPGQLLKAADVLALYKAAGHTDRIFPGHHSGPQNPHTPTCRMCVTAPLMVREYPPGKKHPLYRVQAVPIVTGPPNDHEFLAALLANKAGETHPTENLRTWVRQAAKKAKLPRPSLERQFHQHTMGGRCTHCQKQPLLLRVGHGQYKILGAAPELALHTESWTQLLQQQLHAWGATALEQPDKYLRPWLEFQPELQGVNQVLEQQIPITLALALILEPNATSAQEQLVRYTQRQLNMAPEAVEKTLYQLHHELLRNQQHSHSQTQRHASALLRQHDLYQHLIVQLWQSDAVAQWENYELCYYEYVRFPALEVLFNEHVHLAFQRGHLAPGPFIRRFLDWFIGYRNHPDLKAAWLERQQRMQRWSKNEEAHIQTRFQQLRRLQRLDQPSRIHQALELLSDIPGLEPDYSDSQSYNSYFLVTGLLSLLFPQHCFTVSPPTLQSLQVLARYGHIALDLPSWNEHRVNFRDIAQIQHQVQQLCKARNQQWQQEWLYPRRLDRILFALRDFVPQSLEMCLNEQMLVQSTHSPVQQFDDLTHYLNELCLKWSPLQREHIWQVLQHHQQHRFQIELLQVAPLAI